MTINELTPEQLFVQVVEAGSFKGAAEQLGLEPSSLSRKIAALEDRLGVKLLHRSTRRSTMTELGQLYYSGLLNILDEKSLLEEKLLGGQEALRGKLRIGAPVDFGAEYIVPVVHELQQSAPELKVELLLSSDFVNLLERNIDVVIRIGELADSSLIAKKLGDIERVLVASPGYLKERGEPQNIDSLGNHNFLLYSPQQGKSDIEFCHGKRFSHTRMKSNLTVNSVSAIRDLVKKGAGIHLGPEWIFREDLKVRKVVRLLPDLPLKSFPAHALYVERSFVPRKTRLFIEAMRERLK